MGKLILLPGVDLNPPSRSELVDEISEMMMKEVMTVFIEQQFEPGCHQAWHRDIRDFFWRTEIKLVNRDFREEDLRRWRTFWKSEAMRDIQSRRVR